MLYMQNKRLEPGCGTVITRCPALHRYPLVCSNLSTRKPERVWFFVESTCISHNSSNSRLLLHNFSSRDRKIAFTAFDAMNHLSIQVLSVMYR
ncbi:hypothetical protein L6452_33733 [Arctium lappa]|uniref:Uncharacterized protein n=1 Tax=Arctium lappa TaxID=4217 RepID=A0ACB8YFI2_ARCLA|nr:hypothetical protein L6452_33733 [Arctium lappa]